MFIAKLSNIYSNVYTTYFKQYIIHDINCFIDENTLHISSDVTIKSYTFSHKYFFIYNIYWIPAQNMQIISR
jgi:hypothetical protein